jgi:hypothetical protein
MGLVVALSMTKTSKQYCNQTSNIKVDYMIIQQLAYEIVIH